MLATSALTEFTPVTDFGKTDEYIETLDGLYESLCAGEGISAKQGEALEIAQDALSFAQALWNLFADQQLHAGGDSPDFSQMENIIDALNGELAAAVLFINSLNIDAESILLKNAELLDKYKEADVNGQGPAAVPQVVIEGNRRLSVRVKNTKIALAAKTRTKLTAAKSSIS